MMKKKSWYNFNVCTDFTALMHHAAVDCVPIECKKDGRETTHKSKREQKFFYRNTKWTKPRRKMIHTHTHTKNWISLWQLIKNPSIPTYNCITALNTKHSTYTEYYEIFPFRTCNWKLETQFKSDIHFELN